MADQLKKILDEGSKALSWINSYVDRGNFQDATRYLNTAKDKAKELAQPQFAAFANDGLVKDFLNKIDEYEKKIANGMVAEDIKDRKRTLESSKGWLSSAMQKGDVSQIQKYVNDMTPKVNELESKYAADAAVAKYCAEMREFFEKAHQAAADATRKEAIQKIKGQVESSVRWLKSYMDKKDVDQILKYVKDITPNLAELESKFGDDAVIAKFAAETRDLLEKAQSAAGGAARDEEIKKIQSRLESAARWLKGFIDKGDISQILKYCESMPPDIAELESKFGDDAKVAKFVAEMKDLIEKGKVAAGDATKKEDIQKLKSRLESSARWLRGFMDKGDVGQMQKYIHEMPANISELESKYGDDAAVARFVTEMKNLVEEAQKSAGAATRKEDIENLKRTLESSKRWLSGSIDKGETDRILKYVSEMKPKLEELESKFGDDESVARYAKDLKKYLEEAEVSAAAAEKEHKVAASISAIEQTRRWLQQYYDKQDIGQTMKYIEQLKPMMEELSQFLDMSNAKRCYDATKDLTDRAMNDLGSIAAKQDIEQIQSQIDQTIRWLNQYIDSRDDGAALKYREQLESQVKPIREKYPDNEHAVPLLKKVDEAVARVDAELGGIIAEKEIAHHVGPAEARMKWVEQGLDRRDPDLVQREMRNLMEHVTPLRERYSDHPNAKPLLTRADELEKRVDAELGELILDREIGEIAPASESVLYWLLQALDQRKPHEVQTYQKQLLEKLQPLRRYAGKAKADAVLHKAQLALDRVDSEIGTLIAEIEIADAASLLNGPLSSLSAAIDSRNVVSAQRAKERVISASEILRSKYSANASARPHLDRVDAELARCDAELGNLMAEEKVREVSSQVRGLISAIQFAQKGNEKMVVTATLKKLHALVYPLRALYGDKTAAITLLQEVDAIQGLEINDTIKETVTKQLQKFAPTWEKLQKESHDPKLAPQLARNLKQFNTDTLSLRKGWTWVPQARDFLLNLDVLNLRVFGSLPPDDADRLPIFEVSMKLPLDVQGCIKAINSIHADANKYVRELEAALPCPDLTGRSRVNPYSSDMDVSRSVSDVSAITDRWIKTRAEIRGYTKRLDENDHSPLKKLMALDANHPVVSQTVDARDTLEKWITEQMKFWEPRWRYATRNLWAVKAITFAEKGIQEVLKVMGKEKGNRSGSTYYTLEGMGSNSRQGVQIYNLCSILFSFLKEAEQNLKDAAFELENDHPEVDMHRNTVRRLKAEAELLCFRMHDEWLEFLAQNGEYEIAKGFAEEVEKLFPKDPRTKELLDKFDEIKARRDRARKELAQRTRLQEERLAESSAALSEQFEQWKQSKAPIEVNVDTVMDNIAAYKNKYILIPDKPVFYVEDTIEMNGEDWRYTHADAHSSIIGHVRSTNFKKWEQLKDQIHVKYRLPKNDFKESMHNTQSYPLLGYNKELEWDHSSECVAKIVGVHRWEVVETRYVSGKQCFFKVDKRAPLVVIEGCRSKHLTAWLAGSQSIPEEKVNGVTFNIPKLDDLIPSDVEPLPYWFGKALGAHRLDGSKEVSNTAPTATAAAVPNSTGKVAPVAVKPAATKTPGTPPPIAANKLPTPASVTAKPPAAIPGNIPAPVAVAKPPAVIPGNASAGNSAAGVAKPPAPLAASASGSKLNLPPPPANVADRSSATGPGSGIARAASPTVVSALPPPAVSTPPSAGGVVRPISPRPVPAAPGAVAASPTAGSPAPGTPPAAMKPLAKLPPTITATVVKPAATGNDALLAERQKIEAEIAAKQKRLEKINKLLAGGK